ncbi:uncharacterized protein LOC135199398 isoform X2 [Macrobrachium nipponense]|uniref:uncharacterized protein LOC135199398 isoform X2 n=1 Tax=Macrobrachium nipponense TaxID=159736 RepID=UPI0030C8A649
MREDAGTVTMATCTPLLLLMVGTWTVLTLGRITAAFEEFAQDCRIYELKGHTKYFKSPLISVHSLLTVSFYNREEGHYPKDIHVILREDTQNGTNMNKIHINPDGVLFLDRAKLNNLTLSPSCQSGSWLSLAIMLQDQNIVIYEWNFITAGTILGPNASAEVTTSQDSLYISTNCPAGCLMHNHQSPWIGQPMPLGRSVNIYLSHEEGAASASLLLGFTDYQGKNHTVNHDITQFESSLWHKIVIAHDGEDYITVQANGIEKSKVKISEENSTFTILSSTNVLWSLHCHPEHATGLEGWGGGTSNTTQGKSSQEDQKGAGAPEVVAWVLAGMALFLVMIMALFICTKMGPKSETTDYGASVGVVTSYGRAMTYRHTDREAEEDTEPDSPTFLAPVIQHKVPEEEDEDQSNTKML